MNGHTVEATYKFVNSDVLEHSVHRHEPPVSAQAITVVKDDGDVIVVDKPASIPVCVGVVLRHAGVLCVWVCVDSMGGVCVCGCRPKSGLKREW